MPVKSIAKIMERHQVKFQSTVMSSLCEGDRFQDAFGHQNLGMLKFLM